MLTRIWREMCTFQEIFWEDRSLFSFLFCLNASVAYFLYVFTLQSLLNCLSFLPDDPVDQRTELNVLLDHEVHVVNLLCVIVINCGAVFTSDSTGYSLVTFPAWGRNKERKITALTQKALQQSLPSVWFLTKVFCFLQGRHCSTWLPSRTKYPTWNRCWVCQVKCRSQKL